MNTVESDKKPRHRAAWPAAVLGGLGLVLALVAVFAFLSVPRSSVGDVSGVESTLVGVPPSTSVEAMDSSEDPPAQPPQVETESQDLIAPNEIGRLDEISSSDAAQPIRLSIDGISVDAPVVPHGVDQRTGLMDVPSNVDDVAWYRYGPSPGDPGSAVLAAHVDLASRGPGVFFNLRSLEPGNEIVVDYSDGTRRAFVVQARATYDKDELPLDRIFSRQGSPVLTLITCGGGFSRSSQTYDSNVVVYAIPLDLAQDEPDPETA